MGISTHCYTVYGVFLDGEDEPVKAFLDDDDIWFDNEDDPTVILDMDCTKIYLGKILFDSGDLRWGGPGDYFVEIDLNTLPAIEAEYKKEFIARFPKFESLVDVPFKLMTFVNYS